MRFTKIVTASLTMVLSLGVATAQKQADPLKSGFENPPASARPRVWWHWMNGNITKEGIKLDLEWMHRVGHRRIPELRCGACDAAGGGQAPGLHDAGVEGRLQIRDHAGRSIRDGGGDCRLAGLERDRAVRGCPRAKAMKKYVWSETRVEGGQPFTGTLAHPPSNTGAFQNLPIHDVWRRPGTPFKAPPQFYADAVVVAYKAGGERRRS